MIPYEERELEMSNKVTKQEFLDLADAWIDGRASFDQGARLELLAASSPELMRLFADLSLIHASLMRVADNSLPAALSLDKLGTNNTDRESARVGLRPWLRMGKLLLATAAIALIALFFSSFFGRPQSEKTFARLNAINGTRWISASVPTSAGSRIGSGSLKLDSGLVSIAFDVGAVLELEGPAEFEVIHATRCRLVSGKLLATVRTNFKGFVVETPNAILTDQGTSFCVSVGQNGESKMQVLEGRVDVEDRTTGQARVVLRNNGVRLSPGSIVDSKDIEQGSALSQSIPVSDNRLVFISTATGKGTEYWIQRDNSKPGSASAASQNILLVKWADERNFNYDRKAYLKFDLSNLQDDEIKHASLHLNATPSGLGFASLAIDSSFAVFGVTDDTLDGQTPNPTWEDAPANAESGGSVDLTAVRLLGRFMIPQGVQQGTFSIQSDELRDFLTEDQNRIVTLVVVCETRSVAGSSIVFGFAGTNNNSFSPPTLRLELAE